MSAEQTDGDTPPRHRTRVRSYAVLAQQAVERELQVIRRAFAKLVEESQDRL
jgi:hypothetical protein